MKKLLAIMVVLAFVGCSESNKNETVTDLKDSTATSTSTSGSGTSTTDQNNNTGTNSMRDSTAMMDRQLSDTSNRNALDSMR